MNYRINKAEHETSEAYIFRKAEKLSTNLTPKSRTWTIIQPVIEMKAQRTAESVFVKSWTLFSGIFTSESGYQSEILWFQYEMTCTVMLTTFTPHVYQRENENVWGAC